MQKLGILMVTMAEMGIIIFHSLAQIAGGISAEDIKVKLLVTDAEHFTLGERIDHQSKLSVKCGGIDRRRSA